MRRGMAWPVATNLMSVGLKSKSFITTNNSLRLILSYADLKLIKKVVSVDIKLSAILQYYTVKYGKIIHIAHVVLYRKSLKIFKTAYFFSFLDHKKSLDNDLKAVTQPHSTQSGSQWRSLLHRAHFKRWLQGLLGKIETKNICYKMGSYNF